MAAGIARRQSFFLHPTPALRGYICTNTNMDSTKRGFTDFTASSHTEGIDDDGGNFFFFNKKVPTVVGKSTYFLQGEPIRLTSF